MTENEMKHDQPEAPPETAVVVNTPKGSLRKYIVLGGGGLGLVGLIVVIALLVFGEKNPDRVDSQQSSTEHSTETFSIKKDRESPDHDDITAGNAGDRVEDTALAHKYEAERQRLAQMEKELNAREQELDGLFDDDAEASVIDEVMKNLEFLDYEPAGEDVEEWDQYQVSSEDTVEEMSRIDAEKAKLAKDKAALAAREKELEVRQRQLDVLDKTVSQKLLKLEQAESTRIANLAKLYDGMDPRAVAKLIANLDDNTVVSILPRMKLKNASQVLSLMSPKRAAKLSKQMITIAEK